MKPQFSADLIARQRLLAEREMVEKAMSRRQLKRTGVNRTKEQQREADSFRQMEPEVQQAFATDYMKNNQNMATSRIEGFNQETGQFDDFNPKKFGAQAWGGKGPGNTPVQGQTQLNENIQAASGNHPGGLLLGKDPSIDADGDGQADGGQVAGGAPAPAPAAQPDQPAPEQPPAQPEVGGAQPDNDGDGVPDQPAAPAPGAQGAQGAQGAPAAPAPAPQAQAPQAPAPQAQAPAPQMAGLDPRVTQMAQMQAAGKDAQITQGARPEKAKWSDKTLGQKIGSVALGAATGGLSALGGMAMRGLQNIGVGAKQQTYDQAQSRQNMRAMGINPTMAAKSAQNIHEGISHLSIRKAIQKQEEWEKQRDAGEDYVEGWDNPADYDRAHMGLEGLSVPEALKICEAGGCVWLKDWAEENYGDDDDPHYHYPIEDPDDLRAYIEDGLFDDMDNAPVILEDPFTGDEDGQFGPPLRGQSEDDEEYMADAMRSARIGNDSASFEDLMADRQRAIDQGIDLREHYNTGAKPREDDDLGKGLEMLNIRNSIQKGE